MTPFRFVCKECGAVVLEENCPSLQVLGGKHHQFYLEHIQKKVSCCPKCKRKLVFPPEKVDVWPIMPIMGETE